MLQPAERAWWWKVAMHLDEAQLSMAKVLTNNVDDPTPIHLLQGKLRDAQAFLLEIFRWKGLLPGLPVGAAVAAQTGATEGTVTAAGPSVNVSVSTADSLVEDPAVSVQEGADIGAGEAANMGYGEGAGTDEAAPLQESLGIPSVDDPVQDNAGLPGVSKSASNLRAVDELVHREGLDR